MIFWHGIFWLEISAWNSGLKFWPEFSAWNSGLKKSSQKFRPEKQARIPSRKFRPEMLFRPARHGLKIWKICYRHFHFYVEICFNSLPIQTCNWVNVFPYHRIFEKSKLIAATSGLQKFTKVSYWMVWERRFLAAVDAKRSSLFRRGH